MDKNLEKQIKNDIIRLRKLLRENKSNISTMANLGTQRTIPVISDTTGMTYLNANPFRMIKELKKKRF